MLGRNESFRVRYEVPAPLNSVVLSMSISVGVLCCSAVEWSVEMIILLTETLSRTILKPSLRARFCLSAIPPLSMVHFSVWILSASLFLGRPPRKQRFDVLAAALNVAFAMVMAVQGRRLRALWLMMRLKRPVLASSPGALVVDVLVHRYTKSVGNRHPPTVHWTARTIHAICWIVWFGKK